MKHRWIPREIDDDADIEQLRRDLNDLPEALARSLACRGVTSLEAAERYFRPSKDDLHNPLLMQDMATAAERLGRAIEQGERVLVYGDYDVDGTTATALMTHFLREQGADARYFVPDRIEHGYGLCEAGIDHAAAEGASLIVALDCGVTAHKQAAYAREQGLDLIICDHHTPPNELPDALAVLDPKRPDDPYPFGELSGCGVGFKLVQATLNSLGLPPERAEAYLDLVAIATAADIVPLHGENRILLSTGLDRLRRKKPRTGVRTLAETAGLDLPDVNVGRLVFGIAPRINAAGRLGSAERAVALLLAEDERRAREWAEELEQTNRERQSIDRDTEHEAAERARRYLTARDDRRSVVLHDENWHPGVVGIVASSLVDEFHRPTILLTTVNGTVKGSARSITGINIYDAISTCEDLLTEFGGHDHAAGLSLPEENLPAFKERFNEAVNEALDGRMELMRPAVKVDAPLNLDEVGGMEDRFWAVLRQFAPFGPANHKPVFVGRGLELADRPRTVGSDDKHLKFRVRQRNGRTANGKGLDVIGFGEAEEHLSKLQESHRDGTPFEMLFSIEENTYRGRTNLQLKLRDLRLQEV
jgi:single-stranded-DNA-specific exonuclease